MSIDHGRLGWLALLEDERHKNSLWISHYEGLAESGTSLTGISRGVRRERVHPVGLGRCFCLFVCFFFLNLRLKVFTKLHDSSFKNRIFPSFSGDSSPRHPCALESHSLMSKSDLPTCRPMRINRNRPIWTK